MSEETKFRITIRPYTPSDEAAVIELWVKCNLTRPWNNPQQDISRKLKVNPELFLVGLIDEQVVATAMGGYEGHRGSVNYVAVAPLFRRKGLGRQMMEQLEKKLLAMGCPKINLNVRTGNLLAMAFYENLGYRTDEVISLGKRLIDDKP
jgi:ribosomal protein S18 acetylase RimI-like enzyme